jgi:hypothetical protein
VDLLFAEKDVFVALFAICFPFPSLSFAFCERLQTRGNQFRNRGERWQLLTQFAARVKSPCIHVQRSPPTDALPRTDLDLLHMLIYFFSSVALIASSLAPVLLDCVQSDSDSCIILYGRASTDPVAFR